MSTSPNKSWEEKWAEFCEKEADGFDAFTKLQRSGIAGCFEINGKSFIRSTIEDAVRQERERIITLLNKQDLWILVKTAEETDSTCPIFERFNRQLVGSINKEE